MRRFLYITPYFPPQTKVGALRPLKFVRHLRDFGWEPLVLADWRLNDRVDARLLAALPEALQVEYNYSAVAGRARARFEQAAATPTPARPLSSSPGTAKPPRRSFLPRIPWTPEYVPLGEHALDIPWALSAGARLLRENQCEAIVVNADPYAAMLVGARLGRRFSLPVIHDLRDPWSVCDLRRPQRPALQRAIVDALERRCVVSSARMVLNSDATRAAYVAHYADVPAERFAVIRNHSDAALVGGGSYPRSDRFTMLYMGTFRRYLDGGALLHALAALRARGINETQVELVVTGALGDEARALAAELGVLAMLREHAPVPYTEVGAFMDSADLLLALSNESGMRIPAKFFDYAVSSRPFVVMANPIHTELRALTEALPGAAFCDMNNAEAIADNIAAAVARGRNQTFVRESSQHTSREATRALAAILDESVKR